MSPITVNMDDAIIEDGDYVVMVDSAEEKVSAAGNPMIVATYTITDGPHAGKSLPCWEDYITFSPKAMARAAHALKAFGINREGPFQLDAKDLVGRKALLTITTVHEKANDYHDGRDVMKVTRYQPAPGAAADALVDAAMGVRAQATIADDDDIPF